jgi:glucokinase
MGFYAGIDLGGTNIAVGIVNDSFEIVAKASVKTNAPRPAEEIADDMAKATKMACEKAGIAVSDLSWIGVGTPGAANRETGVVIYSNNLGFHNVPLRDLISSRLEGKPVYVENDANAATYGEVVAGAAKGVKNAIMITLGTGVGGGIIIGGKIYAGNNFYGGELGHTVIEFGGRPCTCGRKGCFESYSSATGLINMTKEEMERNKDSKMWELAGGSLDNVGGRTSFDAMRLGDESGKKVVDEYITYLACGITNLINIFQPEVFIIGGGVCNEKDYLLVPLYDKVFAEEYSKDEKTRTRICTAELGNDAGIIGAAFLGKDESN